MTHRVVTVVAQPVIHPITKPGTIVNHVQGTFPEIDSLCHRTNRVSLILARMTQYQKIDNFCAKEECSNQYNRDESDAPDKSEPTTLY